MATEFLREKINLLRQNVQNESLQVFQHELLIEAASVSTGDKQVDQALQAQAENAKTVVMGSLRRLSTYQPKLDELEKELSEATKAPSEDAPAVAATA